jgi:heme/copper-type cytochrome/quinol oxidase subunit 2
MSIAFYITLFGLIVLFAFFVFIIFENVGENLIMPVLIIFISILVLLTMVMFRFGVNVAETRMYEQIRDDVNITNHKLYRKWIIDNPKEEK